MTETPSFETIVRLLGGRQSIPCARALAAWAAAGGRELWGPRDWSLMLAPLAFEEGRLRRAAEGHPSPSKRAGLVRAAESLAQAREALAVASDARRVFAPSHSHTLEPTPKDWNAARRRLVDASPRLGGGYPRRDLSKARHGGASRERGGVS